MSGLQDETCQVSRQDVLAVLGVFVVLQGEMVDGDIGAGLLAPLLRRAADDGIVEPSAGAGELRLALDHLVGRLRFALGEMSEPLAEDDGTVAHYVQFVDAASVLRFQQMLAAADVQLDAPDTRQGGTGPAQVTVMTTALIGSHAFEELRGFIERSAQDCGGTYEGCSSMDGTPPASLRD